MANRLRIARNRLELKQPEFAEILELSKSSIVAYETGKRPLTPEVVEKLSLLESALDADPELGDRVRAAVEGKSGFLKSKAAWDVIVGVR